MNINFYRLNGRMLISKEKIDGLPVLSREEAASFAGVACYAGSLEKGLSRKTFSVSDASLLELEKEGIELLMTSKAASSEIDDIILRKIGEGKLMYVNTAYPDWKEACSVRLPKSWRINVVGMGDVGGMLITGLRLLGGDAVESIGIYDRDESKMQRWLLEAGQIYSQFDGRKYPPVRKLGEDELFDCDMIAFCISVGVPPVGQEGKDVRMVQFEQNSKIISEYGRLACKAGFKGIFAVVSDPVDPLCKALYIASNMGEDGDMHYRGLSPEQIRGYGLGVMNARAVYYSMQDERLAGYNEHGRAFGPHGEGLVIANSISEYDDELSQELTHKAKHANIEVRNTGFKPYIAPALSSGALSLLATIRGEWHYSSTYMGGVFIGAKNRLTESGTDIERLDLDDKLFERLKETYEHLKAII